MRFASRFHISAQIIVLTTCLALSLPTPTRAVETVIFDNFATGDLYDMNSYSGSHWINDYLSQGLGTSDQDLAMAFTASGSGFEAYGIELALSLVSGDNEVDISLLTDAGNSPGSVMATWHLSGVLSPYPGVYAPVVVSGDTFTLVAGTQYWIMVSTTGPSDSEIAWHSNTVGYLGLGAGRHEFWGNPATWVTNNNFSATMRITGHTRAVGVEQSTWGAVKSIYREW